MTRPRNVAALCKTIKAAEKILLRYDRLPALRATCANIETTDLENLKYLARRLLTLTDAEIETALAESELTEVPDDKEDKS